MKCNNRAVRKVAQNLRLNGKEIRLPDDVQRVENAELREFLYEWFDERPYVTGHTSGSTGTPKEIRLHKADMRASARITNHFFGIGKGSVLLLCLSVSYIAGKMMVVRALEAGADLWEIGVSSHPFREEADVCKNQITGRKIDLAAMVPLQVEETLKVEGERAGLMNVRQLIIGGAPVSPRLEQQLQSFPLHCFATYGMTETVSHVALRRLNGSPEYVAVGEVEFAVDERGCLIIYTPHLKTKKFITNDLVKLTDKRRFQWLGRYDYVINSGGIKFSPEVIEKKIASLFSCRFFITSQPDERLGERIVLVVESPESGTEQAELLREKLRRLLSPYEMPKEIFYLPHFYETSSGKVIRKVSLS